MKMTKKVLFGAAILAMVFGFASCKNEDDDPEGAIKGSNNDYTVSYDNTNGYGTEADKKDSSLTGVYRAWKRTSLKHLGALTKITLNKGSAAEGAGKNSGVMGFAWDLQTATGGESSSDSTSESFNVVGIRNNNGTLQAYVSRFYNITNKQANNFGATTAASKLTAYPSTATEYDVTKDTTGATWVTLKSGVTGDTADVWIDVTVKLTDGESDKQKGLSQTLAAVASDANWTAGAWAIAFYTSDPATATTTPVKTVIIPAASATNLGSCYAAVADTTKKIAAIASSGSQKKQAVYANIYKGHILNGAWKYADTYFKVEPVVDAE